MNIKQRTWIAFFFFSVGILVTNYFIFSFFDRLESEIEAQDFEKMEQEAINLKKMLYVTSAFFVITTILDFVFIQQKDIEAVSEIKTVVKKLKEKDTNIKIDDQLLKRKDEFGYLARALDRTLVSIKLSISELEYLGKK